MTQAPEESKKENPKKLSFLKVMLSVFRASFGVQSQSNKERDFGQVRLLHFIVAALVFTTIFVLVLVLVVRLVLN